MNFTYCDSAIWIYTIDGVAPFKQRATARLAAARAAGDRIHTSELVLLECLIHPLRRGDAAVVAAFDAALTPPDMTWAPITSAVFRRATRLRADHNFETPDALHLAAAIEAGCDLFLTNDARLVRCPGITVEVLP